MTELVVVPDGQALAGQALSRLEQAVRAEHGPFSLFLAGGSTPSALHRALAARDGWPWWRTWIGIGDERCVAPDHPDSNFRAAQRDLLDHVEPAAILRIPGEAPSPEEGAELYARALSILPRGRASVVVLGMGADGHTASLFPGLPPTLDVDVIGVEEPAHARHPRITVTDRFLVRAERVVVLVSGSEKAARLAEVFAGGSDRPLARVLAARGERPTTILADQAAAAQIDADRTEDT